MNMGVQDIGLLVREADSPCVYAQKFIFDLFSCQVDITDDIYAGLVCKHIVKSLIDLNCEVRDDEGMLKILDDAEAYAKKFCADINNSYLWSKDSEVEPKKKVSKKDRAFELYQEHVLNTDTPMSTFDFVNLLCSEFDCDKVQSRNLLHTVRQMVV